MKKIATIVLLGALIFGCKKNIENKKTELLPQFLSNFALDFINFYDADFQSYIILEKYSPQFSTPDDKAVLRATIVDQNREMIHGNLEINETSFEVDEFYGYYFSGAVASVPIFNQSNEIKFELPNGDLLFETDLNVASEVVITSNDWELGPGYVLNYTADANNSLGLACLVRFEPSSPYNASFSTQPEATNFKYISNDNGSFTLTSDLFDNIPEGAHVSIAIVRGGFKSLDINGHKIGILAYSNSVMEAKFQP